MKEQLSPSKRGSTKMKSAQLGPKEIEIPNDWQVNRLGDVIETAHRGKQPVYDSTSDVPVINQSCIRWHGFDETELRYLDEKEANSWKDKYFVSNGDVLLNSNGKGTLGRAIMWRGESGHYAFDSCITKIESSDNLDSEYLKYYFESSHGQQTLLAFCEEGSTGQTSISKIDLLSTPIVRPPLKQQKNIVEIISEVEKQLRWNSTAVSLSKDILAGIRSQLISGKSHSGPTKQIRLGPQEREIPAHWDVKQLSEVAELETGSTPKRGKDSYWDSGDIPWIKSGELNDQTLSSSEEKITEQALAETGCTVFPKGTLLIAMYGKGTVTNTALLDIDAATNQAVTAIFPESEQLSEEYLQQYLIHMREFILNVIVNPSSDTGRTNMYLDSLRSLKIVIPPREEQTQIVEKINSSAERSDLEKQRKERLTELKRGLIQDLLSGNLRLNTNE
jgi:type I restriction enzyme S subunit